MIITKTSSIYNNNDKQEHSESADLLQDELLWIRSLNKDLPKFNVDFLVKDTSMMKFSLRSRHFLPEILQKLWKNALHHNVEKSFKKS